MARLSWLHLSDLHIGVHGSRLLRPEYREALELDLRTLHSQTGPWDLVFISGDLTLTGSEREFELVDSALGTLWDYFGSLGSIPRLLAVPGNHDMWRPAFNKNEPPAFMLASDARKALRERSSGLLRRSVEAEFTSFSQWIGRWEHRKAALSPLSLRKGLLPGDFAATFLKEGVRIGVLGLNSNFRSDIVADGESLHEVHIEQVEKAVGSIDEWSLHQDAILLLTHHPPAQLNLKPLRELGERLASSVSPLLHLCSASSMEGGFSSQVRPPPWSVALHADSLFSEVAVGADRTPRWGYVSGQLHLDEEWEGLRFFPRAALVRKGTLVLGATEHSGSSASGAIEIPLAELTSHSVSDALVRGDLTSNVLMDVHSPAESVGTPRRSKSPELHAEKAPTPSSLPPGVTLRASLGTDSVFVGWMAWAPLGDALVVGLSSGHLACWTPGASTPQWMHQAHNNGIEDLCFSPDGKSLASRSIARALLWNRDGSPVEPHTPMLGSGSAVAWSSRGLLAADSVKPLGIQLWDTQTWSGSRLVFGMADLAPDVIHALAWSRNGRMLACGGGGRSSFTLFVRQGHEWVQPPQSTLFLGADVLDVAWMRSGPVVAMACLNGRIHVFDTKTEHFVATLEGHTDAVTSVSFSYDDQLLASKSHDGTVRLWRTDLWVMVGQFEEPLPRLSYAGLAFSPMEPVLATLGSGGSAVRLWDIDVGALLETRAAPATVHEVSAKVVLVGEGGVGKSCLAGRLANDKYEELGPTHGLKFWPMPAHQSGPESRTNRVRREIILWDLGGQSEYQLVHQLFLRDSTLALMVMQPRQGERALEDIEEWDKRLLAQSREQRIRKILVGAQVDDRTSPVNRPALDALVQRLGLETYVLTSAKTGEGIAELRTALNQAIPWEAIEPVSRPELFQRFRQRIQKLREARRVVLPYLELEVELRADLGKDFDPSALHTVVGHLNRQGIVADSRMADGRRVLILEVEQLERYAGSLVVAARDNPHGVPAIEVARIMSPEMKFPRIDSADRLPRDQELPVLDCVIAMLIEHGICLRHEGLLVFPSLFRRLPHEEPGEALAHSVSLYYDFSGPIDNIYASLVAALAISRRFGALRLWSSRAEFGGTGGDTSGVRWIPRSKGARGVAKLDVYFDEKTPQPTRALFVSFIEEHLREHGVHLRERLAITCACGKGFPEDVVRERLLDGKPDIGCPSCDQRTLLTLGAQQARERDPLLASENQALRTDIQETRSQIVTEVKVSMDKEKKVTTSQDTPIRILHLSDIHVEATDDPEALLHPLEADLADRSDGLGIERLDYLVISGDITQKASVGEFEKAREFVSKLIERFSLTAQRCILVPGNHDLDWGTEVYSWKPKWQVDTKKLQLGSYKEQQDVYLVRDDAKYRERFKNFSDHFYHPLIQKPYPLAPEEQCISTLFSETRLQFLAMNSACRIDAFFRERSAIDDGALSRGLKAAQDELTQARQRGDLAQDSSVLRLAVWHHPVTGNEKIVDDAFMTRLHQMDVRLCLHGHVHEDRADLVNHLHPTRKLHVIGAGSFGAHARERPESVPRLYNLMEVSRDLRHLKVHTRSRRKVGGAWDGWAVWPGDTSHQKRSFYEVTLR